MGVGVAAFVDETVFHQLLHWHHFYDRSTPAAGLVSDGIFHAAGWICLVAGLFLYADLQRRRDLSRRRWWGGLLAGAGAFQLYDGTVQHKVLRMPAGSNPSYLTAAQLAAVHELMDMP